MQSKLMTIGEVAARLGRSVDFVRDETDAGRLKAEPRRGNGHRKYREVSVITYEARYGGHAPRQAPRPAPAPAPQVLGRRPAPNPLPLPEDYWDDEVVDRGPRSPTPNEQVYINLLIVRGMNQAPYELPGDWRVKLHDDLEKFITIERFPYPESEQTAMQSIQLHIDGFLHGYREFKKKEEEKESARASADWDARMKVRDLVAYGQRLLELELATWEWDDPKSAARTEGQTVLNAEVKADWTEGRVRKLVDEVLAQYESDDDEEDDDDLEESPSQF